MRETKAYYGAAMNTAHAPKSVPLAGASLEIRASWAEAQLTTKKEWLLGRIAGLRETRPSEAQLVAKHQQLVQLGVIQPSRQSEEESLADYMLGAYHEAVMKTRALHAELLRVEQALKMMTFAGSMTMLRLTFEDYLYLTSTHSDSVTLAASATARLQEDLRKLEFPKTNEFLKKRFDDFDNLIADTTLNTNP